MKDALTTGLEATVPPEVEAMLLTARTHMDGDAKERLKDLTKQGLDWTAVTNAALAHQVLPLVASSLMAGYRNELSPATVSYLEDYNRAVAARNMMLTAELFGVLEAFDDAGVPAFPYKGPTLAAAAYGSVRLRQFGDLDILVPKSYYMRAKRVLEGKGFIDIDGVSSGKRRYLAHKTAHAFVRDSVHIDLQWGSTARKALSIPIDDSMWNSEKQIDLLGRRVRAIPTEILLVFLCAHGARHQWDRLKWVCDVAEMIRTHPDIDWEEVLRRADGAGARRVVNMALLLSGSLVGAPVPARLREAAELDSHAGSLALVAIRHHLTQDDTGLAAGGDQIKYTLQTKERARDRARFLAGCLFSPTEEDYEWLSLPEPMWFLYRVVRPARLVSQIGRRGTGQRLHSH